MLLTVVYGVLVIGAVCLVALAGLSWCSSLVPASSRQPHNDVAGFIYAALGVIYAVLLALWSSPCGRNTGRQRDGRAGSQRPGRDRLAGHRLPEPEGPYIQNSPAPMLMRSSGVAPDGAGQAPLMAGGENSGRVVPYHDIRASLRRTSTHTRRPTSSSTQKDSNRSKDKTQEGCAWWQPKRHPAVRQS